MSRLGIWLPAAVGLLIGLVLLVTLPGARVEVAVSPALLVAELGVLATAVLGAARLLARRRRERHAEQLQALQDATQLVRQRFVRRLDHELKNPLTVLLTALGGPAGPLSAGDREVSQRQADRIRRLLTDLRRVADVETAELELEAVEVPALLQEAVELALGDSGDGRTLRVEVPGAPWPLPPVRGDRDLLLAAVYNVVGNALKYTAPADLVEVRARESRLGDREAVTIEIADTGPGIPEPEQATMWEELARGSTVAGIPGSGIGLALVDVIVRRHGGTVALQSRHGDGTAVLLHLPALERQRTGPARR